MEAVTVKGVSVYFGRLQALNDVALQIDEGEFVALIGPSGCGKSTLLRGIAGLVEPTVGQIQVFGRLPSDACRDHQIGIAFQNSALLDSRTAAQNVALTLEITGRQNSISPEKVLTDLGLGAFLNYYPRQLSGGMQQRVNIACALAHQPKLLLLDEPFGALDEFTRGRLWFWLSESLAKTGQTALLVTHSVEEAVFLADRVVVFSPRPGAVLNVVSVCFPRPRAREILTEENFAAVTTCIRKALYGSWNGGEI